MPEAPIRPMSPRGTALAKATGTPPMIAVPQSGPMTRRPFALPMVLRAISSSRLTLSLKIMAWRPCRSALRASAAAKSPGTEISARFAPASALTAVRSERGRHSPAVEEPMPGRCRMLSASARADSADAPSPARTATIRSPPVAASPSAANRPASAMIPLFAGVPIISAASSTPSSPATVREIRIKATESMKNPLRTRFTVALMRPPCARPAPPGPARNKPTAPARPRRRPGRRPVPGGRCRC